MMLLLVKSKSHACFWWMLLTLQYALEWSFCLACSTVTDGSATAKVRQTYVMRAMKWYIFAPKGHKTYTHILSQKKNMRVLHSDCSNTTTSAVLWRECLIWSYWSEVTVFSMTCHMTSKHHFPILLTQSFSALVGFIEWQFQYKFPVYSNKMTRCSTRLTITGFTLCILLWMQKKKKRVISHHHIILYPILVSVRFLQFTV